MLYRLSTNKKLAFVLVPPILVLVAVLVIALYPFAVIAIALGTIPKQSGPFTVGQSDFYRTIDGQQVRLRVWYPSDPTAHAPRAWWLPGTLATRLRYAAAYPQAILFVPRWLAMILGLPLALVKMPRSVARDAPALAPEAGGAWPSMVFSHGLLGCVAPYSAVCAEAASNGAVVLTLEHTDGSAAFTQSADGAHTTPFLLSSARPAQFADDKGWRAAQTEARVSQVLCVLGELGDVLKETPAGALVAAGQVDTASVGLMGHSFGGATAIETAAALAEAPDPRVSVSSVVLLDPWMLGCSDRVYKPETFAKAPKLARTLVVMTQSLMFADNAAQIGAALRALPKDDGGGLHPLFVEALGTRHQEASDFVALTRLLLRLTCMAGELPSRVSLGLFCDAAVGFLAVSGAQKETQSPRQARAAELVRGWLAAPDSEVSALTKMALGAGSWIVHH